MSYEVMTFVSKAAITVICQLLKIHTFINKVVFNI
jgi:hypothetical protein